MDNDRTIVGKEIVVVTVTRHGPCHYCEFEAKVFASFTRAEKWIDEQIDALVKENDLDCETAVEDWHVEIDANSSVQFDTKGETIW